MSPFWALNQPDNWPAQENAPDEDCLVYFFEGRLQKWLWNDVNCKSLANFICVVDEDEAIYE